MRMAFGLVSLLVTVGIILWMMVGTGYLSAVSKANNQVKPQLNVMAGKDPTGQMLAIDSIHARVDRTGGRPKLFITEVMAHGPMENAYGVKPGDRVIEIGGLDFDSNIGSLDAANDWFATAYARKQPIVVMRGQEKVSLPTPEHLALIAEEEKQAAIAAAAANGTPPPTAASTDSDRSAVGGLLDSIRGPAK